MRALSGVLFERYRCPDAFLNLTLRGRLSADPGFFQFGSDAICYGRSSVGYLRSQIGPDLYDLTQDIILGSSEVCLPFDPVEVIDNLRLERYPGAKDSWIRSRAREAYYFLRPVLHRLARQQIQRTQLGRQKGVAFPNWPVDRTVENICEQILLLALQVSGADRIPFIWFWPRGARGSVLMTHDVETERGRDFCAQLMDIDDSFGIKASFPIVPERRYSVSPQFLATIRDRGFEISIQDLNHDGRLFNEREQFLKRADRINKYARAYGAKGFRAAVLYRKPDWYDALDFSHDMSIPNSARLDPQRGGCCTVMPYFIGNILELPVTTTQDYTLFNLLGERSIELWRKQIELILEKNGLVTFIVHPDYVMDDELMPLYKELLNYLRKLQETAGIWLTLPSEVDRWWRERSKMQLVPCGDEWRIEGEGAARAILAYARIVEGKLVYEMETGCAGLRKSRELSPKL